MLKHRAPRRSTRRDAMRVLMNVMFALALATFISVANATAEPLDKLGIDKNPAASSAAAKPSSKPAAKPSTPAVSKPAKPSKPARPDKPQNNVATPDAHIEVANAANPNYLKIVSAPKRMCEWNGSGWTSHSLSTYTAFTALGTNGSDLYRSFDYWDRDNDQGQNENHTANVAAKNTDGSGTFNFTITMGDGSQYVVDGNAIYNANCAWSLPSTLDQCTNIAGYQSTVPNTHTQGAGRSCTANPTNQLVGGPVSYCHGNLDQWEWILWPLFGRWVVGSYTAGSSSNLTTINGHYGDDDDIVAAYSYYNGSGVLVNNAAKGSQSFLTNGCSNTPPPPVDICSNVTGTQTSVPNGYTRYTTGPHAGKCVPAAESCDADESPLDNGAKTDSVTGDGVTDACAPNGVTCSPLDQTPVDANANGITDSCAPNPKTCSPLDQIGADTNGNTIIDTCNPNPKTCSPLDQIGADTNGNGIIDTCNPNAKVCSPLDQIAQDTNGNGITDTCAANPKTCSPLDQIGTDTNGNTIIDTCVPNPTPCDAGEGLVDSNNNGINDGCTDIPCDAGETKSDSGALQNGVKDRCNPKSCLFDEAGSDTGTNGVIDTCTPVPMAPCGNPSAVAIDTNANNNADTCATLIPTVSCKMTDDLGNTTLTWAYTNSYGVTIVIPAGGKNLLIGSSSASGVPTSFLNGGGTFNSVLNAGTTNAGWLLTGNLAFGDHNGATCYPDQCPNIEPGDQVSVPAGLTHNNVGNCVPQAVSCDPLDTLPVDDGGAANTVAGDGVNDSCSPNGVTCDPLDQTNVDANNNGITDACAPNPASCAALDQTPQDLNGNGITDTCKAKPKSCKFDQVGVDTNGNGVIDTCNPNPVSCAFDQTAIDTNFNGIKDTCLPKPNFCLFSAGIPIDTNNNGIVDTCAFVTPVLNCKVTVSSGSTTLYWGYVNSNAQTVNVPLLSLKNVLFGSPQPTSFATGTHSSVFSTTLAANQNSQSWFLTGNTATGKHNSTPCFTDQCPNLTGDQEEVPSDKTHNNVGDCVALAPTCETGETLTDADTDTIGDTCAPASCDFDEIARDAGENGIIDTCDPNPVSCASDEVGADSNENGIDDTCQFVPLGCPTGTRAIDTNNNGNPDQCVGIECPPGTVLIGNQCTEIGSCPEGSSWRDSNENQVVNAGECITVSGCGVVTVTETMPPLLEMPRAVIGGKVSCVDCPDGTSRMTDVNGDGKVTEADCAPAPVEPQSPNSGVPICGAGTTPVATTFGATTCVQDVCPDVAGAQENADACTPSNADVGGVASDVGGTSQTGGTGGGVADVGGVTADVSGDDRTLPLTGVALGLLLVIGFGALGGGSGLTYGAKRRERSRDAA